MAMSIEVKMPRRSAEVQLNSYWAKKLGVEEGIYPCYVLGVFQDSSEDGAYPVFVCEMNDGHVIVTSPETVKFVDTDGGMII